VDADCSTQLCNNGSNPYFTDGVKGQCADKSLIAWVDSNAGCVSAGADGSETKPFCSLDTALNMSAVKYVYLKASASPYSITLSISRPVYMFGKGADPTTVTLKAVTVSSAAAQLFLANLTIADSGKSLVQCTGGAVSLLKTLINGGNRGIDASGSCTELNIQQTKVTGALGSGISIAGATKYTVINTGVFRSAKTTPESAVALTTSGAGIFTFNTINDNGKSFGPAGGLDCGASGNKKIVNTIVDLNTYKSNSQIAGNCTLTKVVVGGLDQTTLPGAIKSNPSYTGAIDGQLMASDTACIDQADPDATVTVDYFGSKRPLGTTPDIGYHEAK
jgi:hypothetical protein